MSHAAPASHSTGHGSSHVPAPKTPPPSYLLFSGGRWKVSVPVLLLLVLIAKLFISSPLIFLVLNFTAFYAMFTALSWRVTGNSHGLVLIFGMSAVTKVLWTSVIMAVGQVDPVIGAGLAKFSSHFSTEVASVISPTAHSSKEVLSRALETRDQERAKQLRKKLAGLENPNLPIEQATQKILTAKKSIEEDTYLAQQVDEIRSLGNKPVDSPTAWFTNKAKNAVSTLSSMDIQRGAQSATPKENPCSAHTQPGGGSYYMLRDCPVGQRLRLILESQNASRYKLEMLGTRVTTPRLDLRSPSVGGGEIGEVEYDASANVGYVTLKGDVDVVNNGNFDTLRVTSVP